MGYIVGMSYESCEMLEVGFVLLFSVMIENPQNTEEKVSRPHRYWWLSGQTWERQGFYSGILQCLLKVMCLIASQAMAL